MWSYLIWLPDAVMNCILHLSLFETGNMVLTFKNHLFNIAYTFFNRANAINKTINPKKHISCWLFSTNTHSITTQIAYVWRDNSIAFKHAYTYIYVCLCYFFTRKHCRVALTHHTFVCTTYASRCCALEETRTWHYALPSLYMLYMMISIIYICFRFI